jgi:6,7-dimethyl-8-ribityllumazine synthase
MSVDEKRFAICVSTFYRDLANRLIAGASAEFEEAGVSTDRVSVFEVPGAFELAPAARTCAVSGRFAGVACVGAVIRGETSHYDHVCSEAASGIMRVQLDTGVPCAFGVVTCETMQQALERTGDGKRDQGRDAARAVLALVELQEEMA